MKKWIALLLALVLALSIIACGAKEEPAPTESKMIPTEAPEVSPTETPTAQSEEDSEDTAEPTPTPEPTTDDNDLSAEIEADVEAVLEGLNTEYESLIEGVDSYETYITKQDEIIAFYEKINATSANLCVKMCSYAIICAENVLSSGKDVDELRDDMDIIYELLYDDMGDEIYDGIYDGILDDVYDDLYSGALDDTPDDV